MAQLITFPASVARPTPVSSAKTPPLTGLALYVCRIKQRRMLARDLLFAPDSVLLDAGLTRSEVQAEVAKPFWRG